MTDNLATVYSNTQKDNILLKMLENKKYLSVYWNIRFVSGLKMHILRRLDAVAQGGFADERRS